LNARSLACLRDPHSSDKWPAPRNRMQSLGKIKRAQIEYFMQPSDCAIVENVSNWNYCYSGFI